MPAGYDGNGQLGLGADGSGNMISPSGFPQAVAGNISFQQLAAGRYHTCGLAADWTAWCWGANAHAYLGDGSTTDRYSPVAVANGLIFTQLAAGVYQTCALQASGSVFCWGELCR